jgi:hypothetical protein
MSSPGGHGASSDDELDPDEPRTPLWLPLVGLCLFVAFLIYFLVSQKPAPATERPAPAASASVAAQPAQPAQPAAPH